MQWAAVVLSVLCISGGSEVDGERAVSAVVLPGMAAFDKVEVLGCGPGSALPSDLPPLTWLQGSCWARRVPNHLNFPCCIMKGWSWFISLHWAHSFQGVLGMYYPFCGLLSKCMFQLTFCCFKSKFWHLINLPISRLPVLYSVILRLLASHLKSLKSILLQQSQAFQWLGLCQVTSMFFSVYTAVPRAYTHGAQHPRAFSECWDLNPSLADIF